MKRSGALTNLLIASKRVSGKARELSVAETDESLYEESDRLSEDRSREWRHPCGVVGRAQEQDHR